MIKTVSFSPVVLGGNSKSWIWRCNQNGILRFHNSEKPEMTLELGRKNGNFKFLPTTVEGGHCFDYLHIKTISLKKSKIAL